MSRLHADRRFLEESTPEAAGDQTIQTSLDCPARDADAIPLVRLLAGIEDEHGIHAKRFKKFTDAKQNNTVGKLSFKGLRLRCERLLLGRDTKVPSRHWHAACVENSPRLFGLQMSQVIEYSIMDEDASCHGWRAIAFHSSHGLSGCTLCCTRMYIVVCHLHVDFKFDDSCRHFWECMQHCDRAHSRGRPPDGTRHVCKLGASCIAEGELRTVVAIFFVSSKPTGAGLLV